MAFRFLARPVPENSQIFFIIGFGPDFDMTRATTDIDYLVEWIRKVTKHADISVGKVLTLTEWRCVRK